MSTVYFLIKSTETGKTYRRKKLKEKYENIKSAQIIKVYPVKRNIGYILDNTVYRTDKK